MNTFLNNLFGTIAGGNTALVPQQINFIPANSNGETIKIEAEWIGMRDRGNQKLAYELCFPVTSVVNKLAKLDLNGKVEVLRSKGKGKDNYATSEWAGKINQIFQQPNPYQSWWQFREQQIVFKKIFGFCPVLPIMPVGLGYPVSMINLPSWAFSIEGSKNAYGEIDIQGYKLTLHGKDVKFKPDQIILLADTGFKSDDGLPQSKLVGLDMAISNINAAMEADNVLLKKKGPLGFISHDAAATKDSVAGYMPMSEKEKKEIQSNLQQYGLSLQQYQYVISRTAVKWNPVSFDVKQLMTKETVEQGAEAICKAYGLPYILFKETEATYANGNEASKNAYLNEVIPSSQSDFGQFNKYFKAEENQAIINYSFDHLPQIQEDELERAQVAKAWDEALLIEYQNNLITLNEWRTIRGYDTTPDGDKYYRDDISRQENQAQGAVQPDQETEDGEDIETETGETETRP